MGQFRWLLIAVGVLGAGYFITQATQSRYQVRTDRVFLEDQDGVQKVEVSSRGESLTLFRQDTTWAIVGHDSLRMRQYRIDALLNTVLPMTRETVMTKKPENWEKYSVDDSSGTHLKLYDASDNLLGSAVFGRSMADWSRNYVRVGDEPEVYLTNISVAHLLSASPTHWGEKPPPEPEEKAEEDASDEPEEAASGDAKESN